MGRYYVFAWESLNPTRYNTKPTDVVICTFCDTVLKMVERPPNLTGNKKALAEEELAAINCAACSALTSRLGSPELEHLLKIVDLRTNNRLTSIEERMDRHLGI